MDPLDDGLEPGDQLGQHTLVHRLGGGSFATVWRARVHGEMGFSKDVALKLVPQTSLEGHPDVVKLFADEARMLGLLHHPNIAAVHWFGRLEGTHGAFFGLSMEWIDGPSLAERLGEARLAGRKVDGGVRILAGVADALRAVHRLRDTDGARLGLIHRDVKPANVLLAADGSPKLLDFGVARSRRRLAEKTATVGLRGTLRYMSPEQARGEPLSSGSDIWSLGAVAYEVLCGRRLVGRMSPAETIGTLGGIDPQQVRAEVADVAPEWAALVAEMLQQDPAQRPTAEAVRDRLRQATSSPNVSSAESIDTTRIHAAAEAMASSEPERAWGLPIGMGVALLAFCLALGWPSRAPEPVPTTALKEPTRAPIQLELEAATPPAATPMPAPQPTPPTRTTQPPSDAPPPLGRLRVGSDTPFELQVGSRRWNMREARAGIDLPIGTHRIILRCTDCEEPIERQRAVTVGEGAGEVVYVPLRGEVP